MLSRPHQALVYHRGWRRPRKHGTRQVTPLPQPDQTLESEPPERRRWLIQRRAVEEVARLQVEAGPEGDRQPHVAVPAVLGAEVLAAREVQGRRAVPDRRRL